MKSLKIFIACTVLSTGLFAEADIPRPKNWLVDFTLGGEGGQHAELGVGLKAHDNGMIFVGGSVPTSPLIIRILAINLKAFIAYRYAFSGVGRHSWFIQPEFALGSYSQYHDVNSRSGMVYGPRFRAGYQWIWKDGFAVALKVGLALNFREDDDFELSLDSMFAEFKGFVPMAGFSLGYAF